MFLGTSLSPGDSFRSGRTVGQEWGAGNGICVPELRPQRVGMQHGGGGRGGPKNGSPRSLSSFLSDWDLTGRVL